MKGKKGKPVDDSFYQNLIYQNFPFIEKQCLRSVQIKSESRAFPHPVVIENEALELSGRVLDHLTRNHFQVLRQFREESQLSTYLGSIIARQAVDLIRKKRGRSRQKERAEKYGSLGKQIMQKIFLQGLTTQEAYQDLISHHQLKKSENEFASIVEAIRGNKIPDKGMDCESGENIPEIPALKELQARETEKILNQVISQLDGEDRLVLRMRYPFGQDEDPKDIQTISRLLGLSSKAVYKKISRILKKCRSEFEKKGISLNDLL